MRAYFADTHYFIALLNREDEGHERARERSESLDRPLVTTEWVLVEVGDAMSSPPNRLRFTELTDFLRSTAAVRIIPASSDDFDNGFGFYRRCPDKDWSLTDCISFVVMERHGLTEALTADHHFAQAG